MKKLAQLTLDELIKALKDIFTTKEDLAAAKKELKDDITTFKDEILTEIKNLQDDVVITTGYRDQIAEHDERIEVLEDKVGIKRQN